MSFKEQAKIISDIKNLRKARRELFSLKIYLLCCASIFFSFILIFYLYNNLYKGSGEIGLLFIFLIIFTLSLSITIFSFEILKVSAKKLLSHDAISMLSSDSLNELKKFISSKLLKNKVLFIRKNELDLFISNMEDKLNKMKEKKSNDEFKNKVDSILNENRLNGGNNEI